MLSDLAVVMLSVFMILGWCAMTAVALALSAVLLISALIRRALFALC